MTLVALTDVVPVLCQLFTQEAAQKGLTVKIVEEPVRAIKVSKTVDGITCGNEEEINDQRVYGFRLRLPSGRLVYRLIDLQRWVEHRVKWLLHGIDFALEATRTLMSRPAPFWTQPV